jgi:hypothetical protein
VHRLRPTARISIWSTDVALATGRVADLPGGASLNGIPLSEVGGANLQDAANTLILTWSWATRLQAGGSRVTGDAKCFGRAALEKSPGVCAVDDRAFLHRLQTTGFFIAASGTNRARAAAAGGREVADQARRAVVDLRPFVSRAVALLPGVALAPVLAGAGCDRAFRRVAIAIGLVAMERVETGLLVYPFREIGGTRLQSFPTSSATIVRTGLTSRRNAFSVGRIAQGGRCARRTRVPRGVGPAAARLQGRPARPAALMLARRTSNASVRCRAAVGRVLAELLEIVARTIGLALLQGRAVAVVCIGRAGSGDAALVGSIAKCRGSTGVDRYPIESARRAALQLDAVVGIAAIVTRVADPRVAFALLCRRIGECLNAEL